MDRVVSEHDSLNVIRVDSNFVAAVIGDNVRDRRRGMIVDAGDAVVVVAARALRAGAELELPRRGLPLAVGALRVHLARLLDEPVRHRPQVVALRNHDVRQLAALGSHPHLGADVVLVHRMNESAKGENRVQLAGRAWRNYANLPRREERRRDNRCDIVL